MSPMHFGHGGEKCAIQIVVQIKERITIEIVFIKKLIQPSEQVIPNIYRCKIWIRDMWEIRNQEELYGIQPEILMEYESQMSLLCLIRKPSTTYTFKIPKICDKKI